MNWTVTSFMEGHFKITLQSLQLVIVNVGFKLPFYSDCTNPEIKLEKDSLHFKVRVLIIR